MSMDLKRLAVTIFAFSLFQPVCANADVIFSTLGPGNTYSLGGWTVSGASSIPNYVSSASDFTSSGNYSVGQIDVGLGWVEGTNSADVSLWTDSGGLPGLQLGSWSVSGQPALGSTNNTLTTISGIAGVNLISGDSYILIIDPGAADTWDAWNQDTTGQAGLLLQSEDGDHTWNSFPGSPLGAFDVLGGPIGVPEPSSLAIIGAGLLGLAALCRRRKANLNLPRPEFPSM